MLWSVVQFRGNETAAQSDHKTKTLSMATDSAKTPHALKGGFQFGQGIEQIDDQSVVGDLKDRGVFVLVDRDDDF